MLRMTIPAWLRSWTNFVVATSFLLVCAQAARAASPPPGRDPLLLNRDLSVNPAVDFFAYANGGWLKANPIPSTERSWGIGSVVREEVYAQLQDICRAAAAAHAAKGTSEQKVGDFWAAGMDSERIEALDAKPLKPYLDQLAAIKTRAEFLDAIGRFRVIGVRSLFSAYVGQDERNSSKYMVHVRQGGLGLGDRDYYFKPDSTSAVLRRQYVDHVATMFTLLGDSPDAARRNSEAVMSIETHLASRSRTIEQRRDVWANYNKMTLAEFARSTPGIDWPRTLTAMSIPTVDTVIVEQPEFYVEVDSLVKSVPLPELVTYLRWGLVNTLADALSRRFDEQDFKFFGTILTGTKAQRARWKRIMDQEEGSIGELMGQVWVSKYCSPATKARYEKLTQDIVDAYGERIQGLPWMSAATKARAREKLGKIDRKVGYPDKWRDFSTLQFTPDSYFENRIGVTAWWFHYSIAKLGQSVDRTEWDMTPQTYNAYYDGSKVEIVLPAAAFFIPGVPDSLVDDAVLYGYAGSSTIGHELTHGFDDEGRLFDDRGNLRPWWTAEDSVQFTLRANKLADQFDTYTVGDLHVRGHATLGENIADLGGVRLGYEAFKKTDQWKKGEVINGLSPDQRFFLGYALAWLMQRRPEAMRRQLMTDVHAPEFARVNGPVANMPEFYKAFGVKEGDPMWRPDSTRVMIW